MLYTLRRTILAALVVLGSGCDSGAPFHPTGGMFAVLQALAMHTDSATARLDACSLNGSWALHAWPTVSRTDTVALHLSRQIVTSATSGVFRDTLLPSVVVKLTARDARHFDLALGAPFQDTLTLLVDSVSATQLSSTWQCRPTFPLSADSGLVAGGYDANSLTGGALQLGRYAAID